MKTLPLASQRTLRAWIGATARDNRRDFVATVGLFGLGTVAGLAGPALLGTLVDGAVKGTTATTVNLLCAAFLLVLVVQAALKRQARLRGRTLGERVLAQTREEFTERALALPLDTVEAAGTGDLLSRATTDIARIDHAVRNAAPEILVALVSVTLTVAAMVVTSPLLALGMLVSLPLLVGATRWYLRRVPAAMEAMLARWAVVQSDLHETVQGARTAEALGLTGRRIGSGRAAVAGALDAERWIRRLQLRWVACLELSYLLPSAAMLLLGGWAFTNGWVELGTVTTMLLYAQALVLPLNELLWWMEDLQVSATAVRRVLGVREVPVGRVTSDAQPRGQDIAVRGVRFGYWDAKEVLHGIDLTVARGERLAIVGPSGAGKSTLGRLLAGIAAPTSGSVTIGGTEVSTMDDDVLRGEVLLLTQEQHVFSGSLRDNLALPPGEWSDAELLAALDAAGIGAWARSLPEGLDTKLGAGAGAVAVPAARAQQLALARVVLADPHTLVLDEATSLLDTSSARELERSVGTVLAGRTVIAIAHRLHTSAAADRVAVIEDGRITELGPHQELLATNGPYARLWHAATITW